LEIHTRAPKPISQQLLANADLVVLMGRDVQPYAFQSAHVWDFRDLDGEPIEAVRDLRDQIRARVQKLIAEIRMEEFETITTPTAWREMMLCLAAV
jgi:arsenate reductase